MKDTHEKISLVEVIENEMKRPHAFNEDQRKLWEAEEAKKNQTIEERKRKREEKLKKEDEENSERKSNKRKLITKINKMKIKLILVPDHKKSLDFLKAKNLTAFMKMNPHKIRGKTRKT